MITRIRTEKDYQAVMRTVEGLLETATKKGGFHKLNKTESSMLERLSKMAEDYEDNTLKIMPLKPKNLREAIEFKRAEKKLTQAKLAKKLGIGAPKLSQILSGKREPDVIFIKAIHKQLNIDAEFILSHI